MSGVSSRRVLRWIAKGMHACLHSVTNNYRSPSPTPLAVLLASLDSFRVCAQAARHLLLSFGARLRAWMHSMSPLVCDTLQTIDLITGCHGKKSISSKLASLSKSESSITKLPGGDPVFISLSPPASSFSLQGALEPRTKLQGLPVMRNGYIHSPFRGNK